MLLRNLLCFKLNIYSLHLSAWLLGLGLSVNVLCAQVGPEPVFFQEFGIQTSVLTKNNRHQSSLLNFDLLYGIKGPIEKSDALFGGDLGVSYYHFNLKNAMAGHFRTREDRRLTQLLFSIGPNFGYRFYFSGFEVIAEGGFCLYVPVITRVRYTEVYSISGEKIERIAISKADIFFLPAFGIGTKHKLNKAKKIGIKILYQYDFRNVHIESPIYSAFKLGLNYSF